MNKFQPEVCYPNYINLDVNPTCTITLSPTEAWYQNDKPFLYDNYAGGFIYNSWNKVLFTNGSSDSQSVYIDIAFDSPIWFDTIKILNSNIKSGSIKISDDYATWTTIKTITNNTASSIHWFATDYNSTFGTDVSYLVASVGGYLTTLTGARININAFNKAQYIRVQLDTTQIANDEKYIGELYIGQLMFKVATGKCIHYKQSFNDKRQKEFTDYEGVIYNYPVKSIYSCDLSYSRLSQLEEQFLYDWTRNRGNFNFFPTPDQTFDNMNSIDDIYLVTSRGNWNKINFGQSADSIVNMYLEETRFVN